MNTDRFIAYLPSIAASLLAILAPFFFPWQITLVLGIFASLFFPPIIILTGVLLDVLYFNNAEGLFGSSHIPYFTILCVALAVAAVFVQQFVKTRIIS